MRRWVVSLQHHVHRVCCLSCLRGVQTVQDEVAGVVVPPITSRSSNRFVRRSTLGHCPNSNGLGETETTDSLSSARHSTSTSAICDIERAVYSLFQQAAKDIVDRRNVKFTTMEEVERELADALESGPSPTLFLRLAKLLADGGPVILLGVLTLIDDLSGKSELFTTPKKLKGRANVLSGILKAMGQCELESIDASCILQSYCNVAILDHCVRALCVMQDGAVFEQLEGVAALRFFSFTRFIESRCRPLSRTDFVCMVLLCKLKQFEFGMLDVISVVRERGENELTVKSDDYLGTTLGVLMFLMLSPTFVVESQVCPLGESLARLMLGKPAAYAIGLEYIMMVSTTICYRLTVWNLRTFPTRMAPHVVGRSCALRRWLCDAFVATAFKTKLPNLLLFAPRGNEKPNAVISSTRFVSFLANTSLTQLERHLFLLTAGQMTDLSVSDIISGAEEARCSTLGGLMDVMMVCLLHVPFKRHESDNSDTNPWNVCVTLMTTLLRRWSNPVHNVGTLMSAAEAMTLRFSSSFSCFLRFFRVHGMTPLSHHEKAMCRDVCEQYYYGLLKSESLVDTLLLAFTKKELHSIAQSLGHIFNRLLHDPSTATPAIKDTLHLIVTCSLQMATHYRRRSEMFEVVTSWFGKYATWASTSVGHDEADSARLVANLKLLQQVGYFAESLESIDRTLRHRLDQRVYRIRLRPYCEMPIVTVALVAHVSLDYLRVLCHAQVIVGRERHVALLAEAVRFIEAYRAPQQFNALLEQLDAPTASRRREIVGLSLYHVALIASENSGCAEVGFPHAALERTFACLLTSMSSWTEGFAMVVSSRTLVQLAQISLMFNSTSLHNAVAGGALRYTILCAMVGCLGSVVTVSDKAMTVRVSLELNCALEGKSRILSLSFSEITSALVQLPSCVKSLPEVLDLFRRLLQVIEVHLPTKYLGGAEVTLLRNAVVSMIATNGGVMTGGAVAQHVVSASHDPQYDATHYDNLVRVVPPGEASIVLDRILQHPPTQYSQHFLAALVAHSSSDAKTLTTLEKWASSNPMLAGDLYLRIASTSDTGSSWLLTAARQHQAGREGCISIQRSLEVTKAVLTTASTAAVAEEACKALRQVLTHLCSDVGTSSLDVAVATCTWVSGIASSLSCFATVDKSIVEWIVATLSSLTPSIVSSPTTVRTAVAALARLPLPKIEADRLDRICALVGTQWTGLRKCTTVADLLLFMDTSVSPQLRLAITPFFVRQVEHCLLLSPAPGYELSAGEVLDLYTMLQCNKIRFPHVGSLVMRCIVDASCETASDKDCMNSNFDACSKIQNVLRIVLRAGAHQQGSSSLHFTTIIGNGCSFNPLSDAEITSCCRKCLSLSPPALIQSRRMSLLQTFADAKYTGNLAVCALCEDQFREWCDSDEFDPIGPLPHNSRHISAKDVAAMVSLTSTLKMWPLVAHETMSRIRKVLIPKVVETADVHSIVLIFQGLAADWTGRAEETLVDVSPSLLGRCVANVTCMPLEDIDVMLACIVKRTKSPRLRTSGTEKSCDGWALLTRPLLEVVCLRLCSETEEVRPHVAVRLLQALGQANRIAALDSQLIATAVSRLTLVIFADNSLLRAESSSTTESSSQRQLHIDGIQSIVLLQSLVALGALPSNDMIHCCLRRCDVHREKMTIVQLMAALEVCCDLALPFLSGPFKILQEILSRREVFSLLNDHPSHLENVVSPNRDVREVAQMALREYAGLMDPKWRRFLC